MTHPRFTPATLSPGGRARASLARHAQVMPAMALHRRWRTVLAVVLPFVLTAAMLAATSATPANADPCSSGGNKIACENSKPGTPAAIWDIDGAGDPTIQGFATDISVNVGNTISFKIDTDARAYDIDIYRTGWYGGDGARHIASIQPSAALPQRQPQCITDLATELYDCGTWGVSASWAVPASAVSGVYVARLNRTDTGGQSHIIFIVRDDASTADVLFQTSDPTWHAYNSYGGSDFYQGGANNRAYKVSYNRPFNTREGVTRRDFYFSSEYAQVRFLERNGYDVTYASGVDTDRFGAHLLNHRVFLSVGHDEYWSAAQRKNIEAARDAGVNMQFLTGNEGYWHTRYEQAASTDATAYRTLVSYKETWSNAKIDPSPEWTGTWRDTRYASKANGAGLPENAVSGTIYMVNHDDLPVTVSAIEGKNRIWRNTSLTSLAAGRQAELAPHTVGYESNEDVDNGFRPAGLIRLSTTVGDAPEYLLDFGNTVSAGTTTHHITLYRAPSGALVFSAGSVQWAWGLDQAHDGDGAPADSRMQQAQVNLLADMGAQPVTLMPGLVATAASSDHTPPSVTITSPAPASTVPNGSLVTVTGTASDIGGVVAGVEVSTDGGSTWHTASGTANWSYGYYQRGKDAQSIMVRAIDDSANYPSTPATVALTVPGPYSVFGDQVPQTVDSDDTSAVELGLQFSAQISGFVSGVRFYKSAANQGVHTGSLWDATGTRLASVTFSGESATGWQNAYFSSAVPVAAGQRYVVSYTAPLGHYAVESHYWPYSATASPPLAVASGFGAPAPGVYAGPGQFPTQSFALSNYFVDAIFDTVNTTPLAAFGQWPRAGSTGVPVGTTVSVSFSNDVDPASVTLAVTGQGGAPVGGSVSYDATTRTALFTPSAALAAETTFSAKVNATSITGGPLASGTNWSFTTAAASAAIECPCSLFSSGIVPAILAVDDTGPVTLGVKFTARTSGSVTGIAFYKSQANTGQHTGSLWSAAGDLLASAVFVNESATGWQTVYFSQPIIVQAGSEYVAAYRTNVGAYSATLGGFSGAGFTRGPLSVGNSAGMFTYGTGFPGSVSTTNYFVDLVFSTDLATTAPASVGTSSPTAGQTGVATDAVISATIPAAAPTSTPTISLSSASGTVAGTSAWDPATKVLSFTPSAPLAPVTVYTATVAIGGVVLVGGTWSFTTTTAPLSGTFTLHDGESPQGTATDDTSAVELGMAFSVTQPGSVTAIRFYKGTGSGGTHVGTLWSDAGVPLASITFTGETATGWQTAALTTPVSLTPGIRYVVSYLAPQGRYSYTSAYFASPRTSGPIVADPTQNGLYRYGAAGGFPAFSWNASSYFVDVAFVTADLVPVPPPIEPTPVEPTPIDPTPAPPAPAPVTLTSVTPLAGATDVAPTTLVVAQLSGLGSATPALSVTGAAGAVAGTTGYDAATGTVTFTPSAPLAWSASYQASVSVSGVAVTGGSWSFTTAAEPPPPAPVSLFSADAVPAVDSWDDTAAVQVGTRFVSSVSGTVTGIRFYKGAANTGVHTGYLWSAAGVKLAEIAFTTETTAGWQVAMLATPVALLAGAEYRVGLHSTTGHYALTLSGLAAPIASGPLTALGGAYIYSQEFPVGEAPHNYWVDVLFTPAI